MVTILKRLELSNPEGVSIHHQLLDILTDPDYRSVYDINLARSFLGSHVNSGELR